MSITSGVIVFCEGERDGADQKLLENLLKDQQVTGYTIRPCSGKRGIRAFIQGYLMRSTTPYIVFRDRDFDSEPPPNPKLIHLDNNKKEIWGGYRATLENYLLEPTLLHQYLGKHVYKNPDRVPTIDEISRIFEEAAEEMQAHQAVRWALASLIGRSRWPKVSTGLHDNPKHSSGHPPDDLSFEACLQTAKTRIEQFTNELTSNTTTITKTELEKIATDYRDQFTQATFDERLVWFQGKDLFAYIFEQFKQQYLQIPQKSKEGKLGYKDWAAENLVVDPQKHPDLVELANKIRAMGN